MTLFAVLEIALGSAQQALRVILTARVPTLVKAKTLTALVPQLATLIVMVSLVARTQTSSVPQMEIVKLLV